MILLAALPALITLMGCEQTGNGNSNRTGRLRVVATTGMIADLVRQIGSEDIELTQLINAGVDPHLYKPIRDDVVAIMAADVVFFNGLKLEGRMADLLAQPTTSARSHVAMSGELEPEQLLGEPDSDAFDPHIWMDVSQWIKATHAVERELCRRIPDRAEVFRERASALRSRLETLDEKGKRWMDSIPAKQRILVSSHDAFQYFGRRYGLRVEGVQGISTASEAGLRRIPELIQLLVTNQVRSVFKESSVAGKLIDAIIEGAGAQGYHLHVGEELYSDALGPAGSDADTYEGMLTHNFRAVTLGLGGKVD